MAAKERSPASPSAPASKRTGRPRLVDGVKRTTVNFDDEDLKNFAAMRVFFGKTIPGTPWSDQQLLRILMKKGFETFARENGIQPELPLEASTTTKLKPK